MEKERKSKSVKKVNTDAKSASVCGCFFDLFACFFLLEKSLGGGLVL